MRLIDEDVIDAEFIEDQPVVLLVLGEDVLQAFDSCGLLFFDGFDQIAALEVLNWAHGPSQDDF